MNNRKSKQVITRTPFRINFFGGGTDLPSHFNVYGGSVLGTTIDKYCHVSVDQFVRYAQPKFRISCGGTIEQTDHINDIKHNLVKHTLRFFKSTGVDFEYLNIESISELPSSSGVGSSSSFLVGLLKALYIIVGIEVSTKQIALDAIAIERSLAAESGGWQDQVHAAYGGFNHVEFFNDDFTVQSDYSIIRAPKIIEDSCIFIFTGTTRSSSVVHDKIKAEAADNAKVLCQIGALTRSAIQIITQADSDEELIKEFGRLLDHSWRLKKETSNSICTKEIDELYSKVMKMGAYGGKLIGAGGGGFLTFIAPVELKRELIENKEFEIVPVRFTKKGCEAVYHNCSE